jgi:hypothetical protein
MTDEACDEGGDDGDGCPDHKPLAHRGCWGTAYGCFAFHVLAGENL